MKDKVFPNIQSWSADELEKAFKYFSRELHDERNSTEIAKLRDKLTEISAEQYRRGVVRK